MPASEEFKAAVVAVVPALRRFAMAFCRDPVRVDDLVQETVLKALTYHSTFEPSTNLIGWLTIILKNLYRSQYRARLREVEDPDDAMAKSVPVEDNPVRKMEACEMLSLISKLPPIWQESLRRLADGATYDEIAAELHEHVGTIKSRLHRGREMLKLAG